MTLNIILGRLEGLNRDHIGSHGYLRRSSVVPRSALHPNQCRTSIFSGDSQQQMTPCKRCSRTRQSTTADRHSIAPELQAISREHIRNEKRSSINLRPQTSKQRRPQQRQLDYRNQSLLEFFSRYKEIVQSSTEMRSLAKITQLKREPPATKSAFNIKEIFVTKLSHEPPPRQEKTEGSFSITHVVMSHLIRIQDRLFDSSQLQSLSLRNKIVRITVFTTDKMCRRMLKLHERESEEDLIESSILSIVRKIKKQTFESVFWCFAEVDSNTIVNQLHYVEDGCQTQQVVSKKILRLLLFTLMLQPEKSLLVCQQDLQKILGSNSQVSPVVHDEVVNLLKSLELHNLRINTGTSNRMISVQHIAQTSGFL